MVIRIAVEGVPRPGGSKSLGYNKRGRAFIRPANPLTAPWMSTVAKAAKEAYQGELLTRPIEMVYEFKFARPKHHFNSKGQLKPDAPVWHTFKPDLTKIIRSTEDALTGIVWKDDSQVCKRRELKRYCRIGEQPGVTMFIVEI